MSFEKLKDIPELMQVDYLTKSNTLAKTKVIVTSSFSLTILIVYWTFHYFLILIIMSFNKYKNI